MADTEGWSDRQSQFEAEIPKSGGDMWDMASLSLSVATDGFPDARTLQRSEAFIYWRLPRIACSAMAVMFLTAIV